MSETQEERSRKRDALKHELETLSLAIKRSEEKARNLAGDDGRQNEIDRLTGQIARHKKTIQVVLQQLEYYGDGGVRRRPGRPPSK